MSKYLAKIIANDQEGLQMISACSSGAKVKVTDIKYLASNKVFLLSIERSSHFKISFFNFTFALNGKKALGDIFFFSSI